LQDIDKVLTFYYNHEIESIKGKYVSKDDNYTYIHELDISEIKTRINGLRQSGQHASWYAHDEVDFEIHVDKGRQLKLKEEDNKKILKLCFDNEFDNNKDLVYIYFSSLLNILPISNEKKKLNTSDKSIIQHLLQRMIQAFLKNEKENKITFENISLSTQNIINESENLKKKLINSKEKYGNSLVNQCNIYLRNIEAADNNLMKFEFTEGSINKIKSFNGKLVDLEKTIYEAARSAANIFYNSENNKVIIHDSFLYFDKISEKHSVELQETGFDEYDSRKFYKAISLLNKYENAVKCIIRDGNKVTITHVGENCEPAPITGAAVSDSINKHINDFNKLFEKYPDKWLIVKKYLKPIATKIISPKLYNSKQA